jgi:hypothetical protein
MDRRRPTRTSRHVLLPVVAVGLGTLTIATTSAAQAARNARLAGQRIAITVPQRRSLVAARATSAIVIDGRLDDAAWRDAQIGRDFIQRAPDALQPATQRTEARIVVDEAALYVALRLFDSAPDSIVAPLARRDADLYSDWAEVLIDGYLDHRTAFRFIVNPAGVQRDGIISGDDQSSEDPGWDAVWASATTRDSTGWTVEMRIPLSQLRFSVSAEGRTRWGLQIGRFLARRNERSYWSPIAPTVAGFVSQFGTLEGVAIPHPVRRAELMPYLSSKVTAAPSDAANPFVRRMDMQRAVGLDLRLGVSQGFTLTGTINPDFGQVEADPSEVNLTGIESFFSERRPFFLEGSNLFAFDMQSTWFTGHEELFYSRRIGRAPQGELPDDARSSSMPSAATVLGAAKLTGRTASGWKIAALAAMTDAVEARYVDDQGTLGSVVTEPRTRYGVARVIREFDAGSSIGSMLTVVDRDATVPTLRTGALVGGLDGRTRFGDGRFIAYANLLGSAVRGSPEAMLATQQSTTHLFQRPDAPYLGVDSTLTSMRGLSGVVRVTKEGGGHTRGGVALKAATPGFEANDLGLQPRADAITGLLWAGWDGFTPTRFARAWQSWGTLWTGSSFGGERERLGARLFGWASLPSYWDVYGAVERYAPILSLTALRGGPALATPGHTGGFAHVTSDNRHAFVGELDVRGYRDDTGPGRQLSATTTLSARLASGVQISVAPSLTWWRNPQQFVASTTAGGATHYVVGDLLQSTGAVMLRGSYALSSRLSVQLYAQPFLSAGEYRALGEVASSRARPFAQRVRLFSPDSMHGTNDGSLAIGSSTGVLSIARPDYAVAQLNANALLRWEYRPGSTLFVVWSQGRNVDADAASFDIGGQARDLLRAPATNVVLVKVSHWLGR